MQRLNRAQIADALFSLANMLSGEETGHLACKVHLVVSELWEMERNKPTYDVICDRCFGSFQTTRKEQIMCGRCGKDLTPQP